MTECWNHLKRLQKHRLGRGWGEVPAGCLSLCRWWLTRSEHGQHLFHAVHEGLAAGVSSDPGPSAPRLTSHRLPTHRNMFPGQRGGKSSPQTHTKTAASGTSHGPLALTLSWSSQPHPRKMRDPKQGRGWSLFQWFQVSQPEDSQSLPFWTQRKEDPSCKQTPSAQGSPVASSPGLSSSGLASSSSQRGQVTGLGIPDQCGPERNWARPSLEVPGESWGHRKKSWGRGGLRPRAGWSSGTRSLNPICTSAGLLRLARQAVIAGAHALFNCGEVRAVLPPVRGSGDPGGWPHPQNPTAASGWACTRLRKQWGRGYRVMGVGVGISCGWDNCNSGVALWRKRRADIQDGQEAYTESWLLKT